MDERSHRRLSWVLLALALLALVIPPVAVRLPWLLPGCRMQAWFGLPCPLCGMTRALAELLSGRPASATAAHPLVLAASGALLGELLFRVAILARFIPPAARARVARFDVRLHAWLGLAYLAYSAGFLAAVAKE